MNQVQDDEINLFELFQTLWDGKWPISAFVAIAMLLGVGFLLSKDAEYKSKMIYSLDTIPPFYKADMVSTDFRKMFYSASIFEEWKQNNSNSTLVFEDFSTTKVVDGFVFSKREDEQLATLESEKKGNSFILIKSNQLPTLEGFFEYAKHINVLLRNKYLVRAKEEMKIMEAHFKGLNIRGSEFVNTIILINRYIVSAEIGVGVLDIQRPSMPIKVSPKIKLILSLSVVLGGMVGVSFIFVRNAITNRQEKLPKA